MKTLRQYYHQMGLDDSQIIKLNNELRISSFTGLTDLVHEKRLKSLNQAKGGLWNHGPSMTS